jgi:hypothetical protein
VTRFDAGIQPLSSPEAGQSGDSGVRLSRITAPGPDTDSVSVAADGTRIGRERGGFKSTGLPLLLFAASVITTTANGARFMQNFLEGMPPVVRDSDLGHGPGCSCILSCS